MSVLNVNNIDKESGSTLTIGGSGTTVNVSNMVPDVALSNKNLIINGAMNVAQRGTSSTTSGHGTVDRFKVQYSQVSVTQTQESLSSGDPYDLGFRKFVRATNTSVSAATNAYCQIFQTIEAQNVACSGWNYLSSSSYVTLSFWVRSSLAGTYVSYLRSIDGTLKANSFEFTLSANTWTKVTKTFFGDSAITIANDNGAGLDVFIVPYYGTDLTTSGHTNNVWQTYSSSDASSDFAQNWCNTTSATFDLTGIQLEVGSVATPFEHESYGQTLAKCQRYYTKSYNYDDAPGTNTQVGAIYMRGSSADSVSNKTVNISFPVDMRGNPTCTTYSIGGTSGAISDCGTGYSEVSAITGSNFSGTQGERSLSKVLSGTSVNDIIALHFTADAEL